MNLKNIKGITNNFGFARKNQIDKEIDLEILYLSRIIGEKDIDDAEYEQALTKLERLVNIKNSSKKDTGVNKTELIKLVGIGVSASASILGMMMVLKYENSDEIITSKSFSLASKLLGK